MGDGPSFFAKRSLNNSMAFWFSDARNTWCLCRYSSKGKAVKSKSEIRSLAHLSQSENFIVSPEKKSSQSNNSGISAGSLKFGLKKSRLYRWFQVSFIE
jgi:hypothetical protein